jgi:3-hydroxy-5-methyl-1-naphthoate 3-O-methyltransferase
LPAVPPTDPTPLYRARDGIYADDLLVAAVAHLDALTWLDAHPSDLDGICAGLGIAPRPADVLVTLLTAMGLTAREAQTGLVRTTELARDHLVAGSPYDLRPYYASLADRPGARELLEVLRSGRPAAWGSAARGEAWAERLADPDFARSFTAAMDARGNFLAPALARALDGIPATRLLDIAGSSGVYACALVDRRPGLRATVVERAPVDVAARTLLRERGYAELVDVQTADVFSEPLPGGADLHLVSHTLHDWDEPRVRALLAASHDELQPGGWLVDHDTHVDRDKAGPLAVARYSVLLMHTTHGKCWSIGEMEEMMRDAGFVDVELRVCVADRTAVLARKDT